MSSSNCRLYMLEFMMSYSRGKANTIKACRKKSFSSGRIRKGGEVPHFSIAKRNKSVPKLSLSYSRNIFCILILKCK